MVEGLAPEVVKLMVAPKKKQIFNERECFQHKVNHNII